MLLIRLIANPDRIWQLCNAYSKRTSKTRCIHREHHTYVCCSKWLSCQYTSSLWFWYSLVLARLQFTIYNNIPLPLDTLSFSYDFRNMFYFFFGCHQISNIIISKSHQSSSTERTSVLKWNSPKSLVYVFALVSNKSAIICLVNISN